VFLELIKEVYLFPLPDEPEDDLEEPEELDEEPEEEPPDGALPPLEREGDETLGLEELEGGGLLLLEGAE
jgi:hypothetical protein